MATDVLRAETPTIEPVVEETAASTAAAAAPVLSKRAAKKSKKQLTAEAEAEAAAAAEERNIAASIDHPYLSFMHKRIRLYKKKLEKIKALEAAQQSDGKKLNDQQQELVASRGLVEKMIAEFESLRGQFIEVFVAEQKEKEQEVISTVEVANVGESSPQVEVVHANTNVHTTEDADKLAGDAFDHVKDLLRTLHAVTLHQALGTEVPLVLDYFSKVLLGKTRLPAEVPFEENLAESLEEAKRYLTQSDKIVVQEFTYKDLRTMVEKLGVEPAKEEEEVVTEDVAVPAEALPEINFFTDSVIETEAVVVAEEPVTEDKVNVHELVAESIESIEAPAVVVAPLPLEVPEPPPVSAVPAPPKSFAAAAATKPAKASGRKSNGPNPATVVDGEAPKSTEDKPRRRPSSRPKNGSNSPRKDKEGKTVDGAKPDASKPRRSRPQRQNDENHPSQNVKRTSSTGAKGEDRRPRPERQPRKPQETATA